MFKKNSDAYFMDKAIKLAKKGKGAVSPNPLVGAVIVKKNKIIGQGFHKCAGEAHAEVNAINSAKGLAKGATIYVTLEPCCTTGKTPPCTEAILKAGISKVVIGSLDINPKHNGRALKFFKRNNIEATHGVLAKECNDLNRIFNKYITTSLPYLIVKSGISLDGKIATKTGDSKWITSEKSRKEVHRIRSFVDAVLVGTGTLKADKPSLDVRMGIKVKKQPKRIVLDRSLKYVTKKYVDERTIVVCSNAAKKENSEKFKNAKGLLLSVRVKKDKLDLKDMLAKLGKLGITSILCEGGGWLNASFLEQRLADQINLFIAPKIIGGCGSVSFFTGIGAKKVSDSIILDIIEQRKIDCDIMIKAYPKYN